MSASEAVCTALTESCDGVARMEIAYDPGVTVPATASVAVARFPRIDDESKTMLIPGGTFTASKATAPVKSRRVSESSVVLAAPAETIAVAGDNAKAIDAAETVIVNVAVASETPFPDARTVTGYVPGAVVPAIVNVTEVVGLPATNG